MDKYNQLQDILKSYKKIAIAYSGGCDSHFLLQTAIDTLGKENVLAIICFGDMMSNEDKDYALSLLENVSHVVHDVDVFKVKEFRYNDKKRCYYCKKMIMSQVIEIANQHGFENVCDGQNIDDQKVYRPGRQACHELGILSPLASAHLTKEEIRYYSKIHQIPTYNKPSNACLASRFDYDTELTKEKLKRVAIAESYFHQLGIHYVRVRVQGELARIEVEKKEFLKVLEHEELIPSLKELGFQFITLDIEGIRSGGYDIENQRHIKNGQE